MLALLSVATLSCVSPPQHIDGLISLQHAILLQIASRPLSEEDERGSL